MTEHRLDSGFPLYMSVGEACRKLQNATHALDYTKMLFELLVKDTPFRQQDILELHRAVLDVIPMRYAESTVRRRMYDLRADDSIILLDGEFDKASDRVFQWTKTPAPPKEKPERIKSVFGEERAGISRRDPALHFFSRVLTAAFV